jgi:hypothetical protein
VYIGFLNDRKILGYLAIQDTNSGIVLVSITDSTVLVICLIFLLLFPDAEPTHANDSWPLKGAEAFPIGRVYSNRRPAIEVNGHSDGNNVSTNPSSGNPNPSSGSEYSDNLMSSIPKARPETIDHKFGFPAKTRKQRELEEMRRNLRESIRKQDKLNAERKAQGKPSITVMIKDGITFFAPNEQLRDKFHHALDSGSPIPETLGEYELARLSDPNLYQERLQTFRDRDILPEAYVEQYGRDLRSHVLDPDTRIIRGTLGANREANGGPPKIEGYHLYNKKTGFNCFFDKNGRRYRTGFMTNKGQKTDIKINSNMM